MKASEIKEVVQAIIGHTHPEGTLRGDAHRYTNLVKLNEVVEELLNELAEVAEYAEDPRHSVNQIGREARGFLRRMRSELADI